MNIDPIAIPDQTHPSQLHLRTADLPRLLDFYQNAIGLTIVDQTPTTASLAADKSGPPMLVLTEDRAAVSRHRRTTGLYHLAILHPTRRDLSHALRRVSRYTPLDGAADHLVSEALYLRDPDQNGVELYTDRPASQWTWGSNGEVGMANDPLDVKALLSISDHEPSPATVSPQTTLGHIHLQVVDLPSTQRFFHDFLGMLITLRLYPGALFVAAGKYHHHIGANVWGSPQPAPANSVGLISYRLQIPEAQFLAELPARAKQFGYETDSADKNLLRIRDPNGHWLELQAD